MEQGFTTKFASLSTPDDINTVEEAIGTIQELDYGISIYLELIDHLNMFIKTDFGDPSEGIKVWRGGVAVVPPESVQHLQDAFKVVVEDLKSMQSSLMELRVGENDEQKKQKKGFKAR